MAKQTAGELRFQLAKAKDFIDSQKKQLDSIDEICSRYGVPTHSKAFQFPIKFKTDGRVEELVKLLDKKD